MASSTVNCHGPAMLAGAADSRAIDRRTRIVARAERCMPNDSARRQQMATAVWQTCGECGVKFLRGVLREHRRDQVFVRELRHRARRKRLEVELVLPRGDSQGIELLLNAGAGVDRNQETPVFQEST